MQGHVILGKTHKGIHELESRNGDVPRKERSVLIMVDGKTRYADLVRKCAFITACEQHLDWLLEQGFIEVSAAGPSAGSPGPAFSAGPGAAAAPAPDAASRKTALMDLAQELLGIHAGAVMRRLQDAENNHAALAQTVERCHKLIRLSIDEKKAEQFLRQGLALLATR